MTLFRPVSVSTGSPSLGLRFRPLERGGFGCFCSCFILLDLCRSYVSIHNSYLIIIFVLAFSIEMFPINAKSVS